MRIGWAPGAQCALRALRAVELGASPAHRLPARFAPGLGPRLRSSSAAPTGPESPPAGRMWTAPLLLCLVVSASLWLPAQAAVFARLEENLVTSAAAVGRGSPGKEDLIPTTSGSEAPQPSPILTTQAPAGAESTTGPGVEDMSTLASSTQSHQKSQTTTAPPMATETSTVNVTEPTQTTVHKDGLSTVSLAGIVIGLLITICFLGGVIFLFVRKMSN